MPVGRKAVSLFLRADGKEEKRRARPEDTVVAEALRNVDLDKLQQSGIDLTGLVAASDTCPERTAAQQADEPPFCDRCHQLLHHHAGQPIMHPDVESLRKTIEETPYKHNHVYHVLDAADFPMSLLPRIDRLLNLAPLRTKNRRARSETYQQGRLMDMSFIISRSDLLAPRKEQVDSLMPYLREVLRDALGRRGRHLRLGNVHCVSAKRNWWTRELKEAIWKRGHAGWMVGKVNVGKSQLFRAVFPQGRMHWQEEPPQQVPEELPLAGHSSITSVAQPQNHQDDELEKPEARSKELEPLDESAMLPPARPETNYPLMPLIHHLPGTTASPIRVPFGNGRGELIDLPGISRGDLELFVREAERLSLVMRSRAVPEQQVLKPGRSLLLGGFIRITPRNPDLVILAYSFTTLKSHVTATTKAIAIQEQANDSPNVENISIPGTGDKIKLAGSFKLRYDVTKKRAGPITRRDAVNMRVDRLPFRVLAVDLLIEGCGWVEIVAQVRTRQLYRLNPESRAASGAANGTSGRLETLDLSEPDPEAEKGVNRKPAATGNPDRLESLVLSEQDPETDEQTNEKLAAEDEIEDADELNWPIIDVYSPEGRFIGSRRPMNGWSLNKPLRHAVKSRPRKKRPTLTPTTAAASNLSVPPSAFRTVSYPTESNDQSTGNLGVFDVPGGTANGYPVFIFPIDSVWL
ncbi:hypothetical protein P8C59_005315 [Phyllachora maydis]|uniref:Uncharacterized protein n=1 Tax=Phyllachora maydis TaxID=1825666 RepID=A0AAD9I5D6_9PEZI|nr:hypothetical protein P8C59_005315 [Phyllachora maydis]